LKYRLLYIPIYVRATLQTSFLPLCGCMHLWPFFSSLLRPSKLSYDINRDMYHGHDVVAFLGTAHSISRVSPCTSLHLHFAEKLIIQIRMETVGRRRVQAIVLTTCCLLLAAMSPPAVAQGMIPCLKHCMSNSCTHVSYIRCYFLCDEICDRTYNLSRSHCIDID
jgi:hypothetical protein